MEWIASPDAWIALLTLTVLEIVLGIDNIIFISILSGKLPESQQQRARTVGLMGALIMRVLLLLSIAWIMGLTRPLFEIAGMEFSGRDLILFGGGLFLLAKATSEIHDKLEGDVESEGVRKAVTFSSVIVQIMLLDMVFSLDSVITAVGMADHLGVMITAVVLAIGVMLLAAESISGFVEKHPTVKMLALGFLLLIGTALVAEAFAVHIPKGYIYFAMGFSIFIEMLNLRLRRTRTKQPVKLRAPYGEGDAGGEA